MYISLQDICHHSDAPHIRGEVDRIEKDDFRCHEFRRSKEDSRIFLRIVFSRQSEIYNLYPVARPRKTQDVFRLPNK